MSVIKAYPSADSGVSSAMNITGTSSGTKRSLDVAIQSGTVSIVGPIAVTQSGVWDITDITGTISLPTGAATAANQLPDGHNVTVDNASGASAVNIQDGGNSITVDGTIAATQSGAWTVTVNQPVSIDDNGGSITVDGTISATQSGTWNINNISGTISLPTGAATSANQTTMITALQLIDNIVQTEDSAHVSGHSGVMSLGVRQDTLSNSVSANGDYGSIKINNIGALYVEARQTTHDNLNLNANIQQGNADVSTSNALYVRERPANGASTSTSSITTTASSVGGVSNQVSLSIFPIGTGNFYFNLGGTATTSNAYINLSSPLVIENYSGTVSLIRSSGSGSVQVTALTRS